MTTPHLIAHAGWTNFGAWFGTFFPLILVLIVLAWYTVVARRHP
jgi:ABC-type multidrug transport system permease subunit